MYCGIVNTYVTNIIAESNIFVTRPKSAIDNINQGVHKRHIIKTPCIVGIYKLTIDLCIVRTIKAADKAIMPPHETRVIQDIAV